MILRLIERLIESDLVTRIVFPNILIVSVVGNAEKIYQYCVISCARFYTSIQVQLPQGIQTDAELFGLHWQLCHILLLDNKVPGMPVCLV